jgi:hypothetical protein
VQELDLGISKEHTGRMFKVEEQADSLCVPLALLLDLLLDSENKDNTFLQNVSKFFLIPADCTLKYVSSLMTVSPLQFGHQSYSNF